ncbi:hypothetical protein Ari01nite_97760 [Paractinoplanes rishiriensis]|uniref:Uncharacterized protein n=1 Tax=Paractinoplanes rishiriensis TaxID=1050105 RepID=A0A919KDD8_9ACTN|nr:hypothetical protein Ari01nite_97760 [Actinoplanes rishiriensis]
MAGRLTKREIAGRMFLTGKTVKNAMSSLPAEVGLQRRTRQLAVLASKPFGEHPHQGLTARAGQTTAEFPGDRSAAGRRALGPIRRHTG